MQQCLEPSIPTVFSSSSQRSHLVLWRKTRDRLNQGKEPVLNVTASLIRLGFIISDTKIEFDYFWIIQKYNYPFPFTAPGIRG